MSEAFDSYPWYVNSDGVSPCHRPRLYWLSWEIFEKPGVWIGWGSDSELPLLRELQFQAQVDRKLFLESGWEMSPDQTLPTFTTSRPSATPLRRPAGLKGCEAHELERWKRDSHRFPPYQYKDSNLVTHRSSGEKRLPSIVEREVMLGFPAQYTKQCLPKALHDSIQHQDTRLTLLGNSWSIPVIAVLLSYLFEILGISEPVSLQQVVDKLAPGKGISWQSILLRPPLHHSASTLPPNHFLTRELCSLVSLKGEDLLVQSQT